MFETEKCLSCEICDMTEEQSRVILINGIGVRICDSCIPKKKDVIYKVITTGFVASIEVSHGTVFNMRYETLKYLRDH